MKHRSKVWEALLSNSPVQVGDLQRCALEEKLARWWGEVLGVSGVGLHDEFFYLLGGDEQKALSLARRIQQEMDLKISLEEMYEASTISKMADLIEIRQSSGEQNCIVPIRPSGNRKPLFVIHGVGGNVLGYAELARSLHRDQPVYGIQAQSLTSSGPTLIHLEAMAAYYIEQMKRVQPTGPFAFLGLCFGGLVAYEMAQQLVANGEQVAFLGLLDTRQPGFEKEIITVRALPKLAWMRMRQIRRHTRELSIRQWPPYVRTRLKSRLLRLLYRRMNSGNQANTSVTLSDTMRQVKEINLAASLRYTVRPYPGLVTLFRAEEDVSYLPEDFHWREYALSGVNIIQLPGDHGRILAEPSISVMAAAIEKSISQQHEILSSSAEKRDEFELDDDVLVRAPALDFAADRMARRAPRQKAG
jgi:thioesterase domain-containing protein